jgi:hypothetical protein
MASRYRSDNETLITKNRELAAQQAIAISNQARPPARGCPPTLSHDGTRLDYPTFSASLARP